MEPNQAISGGPGAAPCPDESAPAAGGEAPGIRYSGIPAPVTALIGRRSECAGVVAALDASRLVTLMGPGGVGKTRLALAVAAQLQQKFRGRAWWVELAPVTRDDMTAQAIADAMGARDASGLDLAESLAARIADHPALIVLDNCEHLTADCREVADRLLTRCPRLHILATSREPLGAGGESRWPLPPLTVPQPAAPPGAWPEAGYDGALAPAPAAPGGPSGAPAPAAPGAEALLAGSEAMQFFLDRARAVLPGFEITEDNAELIGQLCRRLDGLPLAIELAAAKLRVMAVAQVLTGLDDVFKLLVDGREGGPARHQTLRGALDWSYDMLQPGEQAALRRLSVFAGSFCLPAAQQVATLGGADPRTCSTCWPGWWTGRCCWSSTRRPRPGTGCSRPSAGMVRTAWPRRTSTRRPAGRCCPGTWTWPSARKPS
jgi:non-specific serine/threonine protein kinase